MTPADVQPVVAIISAHEREDGRLAENYYQEFF